MECSERHRREKGNDDSLSATVTEAEWEAANYSINLLTLLKEIINHFINRAAMNHNMSKAAARPDFKMKTNYKQRGKFETTKLEVAPSKLPHNKHN